MKDITSINADHTDADPKEFRELHPGEIFVEADRFGRLPALNRCNHFIRTATGKARVDDWMHYEMKHHGRDCKSKVFSQGFTTSISNE